jgi:hypothetical protein
MSSIPNATEAELVGIVDDAVEILIDRALTLIATPSNVHAWKGRTRRSLHWAHDQEAYKLLAADLEHNGTVTVTAKMLADLLDTPAPPPPVPARSAVANAYELAEQRRRERDADAPSDWLPEGTRDRCIAEARAAIAAAKATHASALAAAKAANTNPSDGGEA